MGQRAHACSDGRKWPGSHAGQPTIQTVQNMIRLARLQPVADVRHHPQAICTWSVTMNESLFQDWHKLMTPFKEGGATLSMQFRRGGTGMTVHG